MKEQNQGEKLLLPGVAAILQMVRQVRETVTR